MSIMQKRFVPFHFDKDMKLKLQCLTQGTKLVEEYHKEMKVTMIWARVEERPENTMPIFLEGLNKEITNILEL